MLPNPHPIAEVAIIERTITGDTQAHRPSFAPDQSKADAAGAVPYWAVTTAAACTSTPAKSWSFGYARSRGAVPCTAAACWGPA